MRQPTKTNYTAGLQDTTENKSTKMAFESTDSKNMDTVDILTYIQKNSENDDNLELF